MKKNVRAFVELFAKNYPSEGKVYQFGALLQPEEAELSNFRPIFGSHQFIGSDSKPGPGVDRIENIHSINLPDESVKTIICVNTLSQVFDIKLAVAEMMRVLAPSGLLLISNQTDFKMDDFPNDYWRLTPSCLMELLDPLAGRVIGSQGVENFPHTVFALGFKGPVPASYHANTSSLLKNYQCWLEDQKEQLSFSEKVRQLQKLYLSGKESREEEKHYYTSRFIVDLPAEEIFRQLAWKHKHGNPSHDQSTGSRINL